MNRGQFGTLIAVSIVVSGSAAAQEAGNPSALEEVVITGSLIKREKSSQLVTTVDAEELATRGVTNALETLSSLSQNQPSATSSDGTRTGGLTNLANLRNVGPENTLVLVNGRRMVNNPIFDNGVDLNTVPTALLGSVDVLADGASSIYGSDAVAGVINYRTRTDFRGLEYSLNRLMPTAEGGEKRSASLAAGVGSLRDDGWNFMAGVNWRDQDPISSADRDFSKTADRRDRGVDLILRQPFPANVTQPATPGFGTRNPYPCTGPALVPLSTGGCGLDGDATGSFDVKNPEEQVSVYSMYQMQLGEHRLSAEYIWAESTISNAQSGARILGLSMPNTNPYYPGNGATPAIPGLNAALPIFVTSRFQPGGRRTSENHTVTDRATLELAGDIGRIGYNLWVMRSKSNAALRSTDGALLLQGIRDGLAGANGAAFINPFGAQSTAGAAYIERIKVRTDIAQGDAELRMAGATFNGKLFDMPAGSASAALAVEHAEEEMGYTVAGINSLLTGNDLGNGVAAAGDRSRTSATFELLLPLMARLEANISGRHDNYSDFGGTFNPKVQLNFDVTDTFNLHASYNKGFRAPPLPKLFAPQALRTAPGFQNDPRLCPGGVVSTAAGGIAARDCGVIYNTLTGGNQNLHPQDSTAYAVGFDLRMGDSDRVGALAIGADYWNYKLTDVIGTLSPNAIFADTTTFASYIVRCSAADRAFVASTIACTFPGGTGDPIAYTLTNNANVGAVKTAGIDVTAAWSKETQYGTFAIDYRGTYVTKYDFQRLPGTPFLSRAGVVVDGFPAIKYGHNLSLGWQKGAWALNLQNRHTGGYGDCNANCGVTSSLFNDVEAYSLWNLTAAYKISDAWTVMAHLNNVFDQDPPFSNNNVSNCSGCDLRFVDPTGRAVGITIRGRFGVK